MNWLLCHASSCALAFAIACGDYKLLHDATELCLLKDGAKLCSCLVGPAVQRCIATTKTID